MIALVHASPDHWSLVSWKHRFSLEIFFLRLFGFPSKLLFTAVREEILKKPGCCRNNELQRSENPKSCRNGSWQQVPTTLANVQTRMADKSIYHICMHSDTKRQLSAAASLEIGVLHGPHRWYRVTFSATSTLNPEAGAWVLNEDVMGPVTRARARPQARRLPLFNKHRSVGHREDQKNKSESNKSGAQERKRPSSGEIRKPFPGPHPQEQLVTGTRKPTHANIRGFWGQCFTQNIPVKQSQFYQTAKVHLLHSVWLFTKIINEKQR